MNQDSKITFNGTPFDAMTAQARRVEFIPERSGRFNPISAVNSEPDYIINLLVQMGDVLLDEESKAMAKMVVMEQRAKGEEVTLLQLVDAFEARAELRMFAAALRKNGLSVTHAACFSNAL